MYHDNKQIQNFLTGSAFGTLFSSINFIVFALVLVVYNSQVLWIFLIGVVLYFIWMQIFLPIRRKINNQVFYASSIENNAALQLVQGMQEIKLQNVERSKRWEWERSYKAVFSLQFRGLTYNQLQQGGVVLIHQGTYMFLTFMVASLVIKGELTLGAMLAVQYILGQLSGPILQFVSFVQAGQDAKTSLNRLNEVHQTPDEENVNHNSIRCLPSRKDIRFNNVSFTYPQASENLVLNNINLLIPEGKTTAIVGLSGSGKTTLIKILCKFYTEYSGAVQIGDVSFDDIIPSYWRKQIGVVLQEGYIFNTSIACNVAVQDKPIDQERLIEACRIANILPFIESLHDGFNTLLGVNGMGISNGQKQRILIARVVYENPQYVFFDEATNALDAKNEKAIVENMRAFFAGKTVIVVAHRLSTVKNADKIVMLEKGKIVEEGTHQNLCLIKGKYYELVKNQLELGS